MSATDLDPRALERVHALIASGGRAILGLVGPPGSGKSTIAEALRAAFPGISQVVPMDGYHLANVTLRALGRADRKGAADTFDAYGYVSLLRRLRSHGADETVYAPEFRREIEEPVAGAIAVEPGTRLVITEGNYLLLDDAPWNEVRALLDDSWYVEVDEALRLRRLVARHVRFGRTQQEALAWVQQTDEPNARRIEASKRRAQYTLSLEGE
ncbi:MAG TPA: nucleoside/nucleotide kinase family protein [Burkholderiaceae bacterium]|jgi:pantothenate kinase|nr:nucleoside/nucleotide kinase family protein [Burkholderiaceae bacterium]